MPLGYFFIAYSMDLQASALRWRKQMVDSFNWGSLAEPGAGVVRIELGSGTDSGQTAAEGVMTLQKGQAMLYSDYKITS